MANLQAGDLQVGPGLQASFIHYERVAAGIICQEGLERKTDIESYFRGLTFSQRDWEAG